DPNAKFTVSGVVTDSISGEPLIFAYVYDAVSGKSTSTNNYGYYSMTLPTGKIDLTAGYVNYISKSTKLDFHQHEIVSIKLPPSGILPPVIVSANSKEEALWFPPAERISMNQLKSDIHIGGSSDLYRTADFIPGVHTGTDGVGGIHVRGGANDQNLILMDGVPVYHPNHLLGIVSVFNYQVFQQATIYKANFPSRFSGRLSSVMDVRTKEGNVHNWAMSGNVSIAEMGSTVEGPLVKDKVGILVSSRFFLPGLVVPDLSRAYKQRNGVRGHSDLDYFDFNGKINWMVGTKDRLYLSTYQGKDNFVDQTVTHRDVIKPEGARFIADDDYDKRLNWRNQTAVLRWNHILSDQIFANFILSTSRFTLQSVDINKFAYTYPDESDPVTLQGFDSKEFKSSIRDVTARAEFEIHPSEDHQFSSGIYAIQYWFQPKSITINEESQLGNLFLKENLLEDQVFSSLKVKGMEAGAYFEDKWQASDQLLLSTGLHVSGFFVQGKHYLDPQLRMSMDYLVAPRLALSMGYSRMAQYLHNLTSSSIGLPTDLWVPTTARVFPALSDQYSFSSRWTISDAFILDFSTYLKNMRNLISYQEGASFLLKGEFLPASIIDAANWESKITSGIGDASGVELQIGYQKGVWHLTANGTWSRSYRTFEDINGGKPFPDRYDRRWSSTFSGMVTLGKRWMLGADFLFGSGIAITLAESKFYNPGSFFPEIGINYSERNGFRLPAYHRLDLSVQYQLNGNEKFNHSLILNLYNVYNRTNPFYITLVQDPITEDFQFRQFYLFKFFPSLSYRFDLK
ncbi:MAG TPA: TonB-dependent receptor, partial [Saprospiraceae bacterium]|nr:TonB-dependent receptor [Saprospiraceae bacterium]